MKKCQELATVLAAEYAERSKFKLSPELHLSIKEKNGEGYTSHYAAGKLKITASSPLAQTYAISQMGAAAHARHLADYLGESTPRFSLRPLWLKASTEIALTERLSLHLPEFMLAEDAKLVLPRLCKRIIECGYNSILIGAYQNNWEIISNPSPLSLDLKSIILQLHDHGLQVILKPNFNPDISSEVLYKSKHNLELAFDELFHDYPIIDGLFWDSLWQTDAYQEGDALNLTNAELALSEIKLLENCIRERTRLIFYVGAPAKGKKESLRQAKWILSLLDDMKKNSILAFNAVNGSAFDDSADDNPMWEILRESPDCSSTPLMPILNVGLVKQGEGLWPVTNFDLQERFLSRCTRHPFAGVIGISSRLPQSGSVLDCNLWVAGQSLWRALPAELLAETWFKAFRPEENSAFCLRIMKKARSIALNLTALSEKTLTADEAKIYGDSLIASIRELNLLWEKENCTAKSLRPSIKDHFPFFFRDVKQLLGSFLPTYNLPLSYHSTHEETAAASFWSHELDTPHRGHKNSTMEAIYLENRYL